MNKDQIKIETDNASDYEKIFENYSTVESDNRPIAIHHLEKQKTYLPRLFTKPKRTNYCRSLLFTTKSRRFGINAFKVGRS